jgi:hypothetical protein
MKRTEIVQFITDHNVDIFVVTETWLSDSGDDSVCADVTPTGYTLRSFPRSGRGGGIALIYKNSLSDHLSFNTTMPFAHQSFELVQVSLTQNSSC